MSSKLHTVCSKCKKKIVNRDYLKCVSCDLIYDLDCANISTKFFDIMKKESKTNWQCKTCKNSQYRKIPNKQQKKITKSMPQSETPKGPKGDSHPSSGVSTVQNHINAILCSTPISHCSSPNNCSKNQTINTKPVGNDENVTHRKKNTENMHTSMSMENKDTSSSSLSLLYNSLPDDHRAK